MSVNFLQNVPAWVTSRPSAKLYVEWAPGADLTDTTGAGWTWYDITNDVLQSNGNNIDIVVGRSDTASQTAPATCSFMLDNRTGEYSRGPQSSKYPNVKLNVPIRVSISLDGTTPSKVTRFQGYAHSLKPSWDETGTYAIVSVSAAGITRRLQHGSPVIKSSMFRYYSIDSSVVAYWPMEDEAGSTTFASAISGQNAITYTGATPSNTELVNGSGSLPTFTASGSYNVTLSKSFTDHFEVDFIFYAASAPAADTAIMRINTAGSDIGRWEIVMVGGSTSTIRIDGYATGSPSITTTLTTNLGTTVGIPVSYRFMAQKSGTATQYQHVAFPADFSGGGFSANNTVAATTVGNISGISALAATGMNGLTLGQIIVSDAYNRTNPVDVFVGWSAFTYLGVDGETPYQRLVRLAGEEGIGFSSVSTSGTEYMGAQTQASIIDLMREAEVVDQGVLVDGLSSGLRWTSHADIVDSVAKITLLTTDLVPGFEPQDDDLNIVNKVTATRKNGTSALFQQTTGNLGTTAIGYYEDSISGINNIYDYRMIHYATWAAHLGTTEGYRYPTINLDLRRIQSKAASFLTVQPGTRADISTIENYVTQIPNGDIRLLVLGYTEQISRFVWTASLNCQLWSPYNVTVLDNSSGTYASLEGYDDTDNSTLNASAVINATSISVATTGGVLWTTSASDLPLYADVGGYRVQVTAISGASSPQTFTISALPGAVSSGAQVKLWQPSYLGF